MTSVRFWRVLFVVLFAVVTYLTLTPNPDDTDDGMAIMRWISAIVFGSGEFGDKVAHFSAYAALGGSAAFAGLTLLGRRSIVILALAAYGAALEALQGWGGVRVADAYDALSNSLGVLVAYPAAMALERARAWKVGA